MSTTERFSLSRTTHLARWNAVLLQRNRLALFYAVLMPLTPLIMLLTDTGDSVTVGASALGGVLLIAALFPVFYNVLAQFVSRRDELVLKRMRTGETSDSELVLGIAVPGVVTALLISAAAVPIASALGQRLPINPMLYAGGALLAVVMFAAFAYWTAAWTRSAEAAQLTSLPVILLAAIGPVGVSLPNISDALRDVISWTPGAAMTQLVRVGWFGLDGVDAKTSTLAMSETWSHAAQPVVVMVVWTVAAIALAMRSMRWEPRT